MNIVNKNMPDVAKGLGKSDEFVEAVQKLTKIDTAKLTREQAEAVREVLSEPELKKYLDEATNPWIRRAADGGLDVLSAPNSKTLRKNLVNSGVEIPDYPNAVHHIVAGYSPKSVEARAILQKYGIDINDAANGVFLPTVRDVTDAAYHPSLHTDSYYRKVTELLNSATSKEDVIDILNDIAEQLLDGTF